MTPAIVPSLTIFPLLSALRPPGDRAALRATIRTPPQRDLEVTLSSFWRNFPASPSDRQRTPDRAERNCQRRFAAAFLRGRRCACRSPPNTRAKILSIFLNWRFRSKARSICWRGTRLVMLLSFSTSSGNSGLPSRRAWHGSAPRDRPPHARLHAPPDRAGAVR